jgi:putative PEP-CTERM system histidine kinase
LRPAPDEAGAGLRSRASGRARMTGLKIIEAGMLGYAGAALGYLLLALLALWWWKRDLGGILLVIASLATAAWAGISAFELTRGTANGEAAQIAEVVRSASWMLLPLSLFYWVAPVQRLRWAAIVVGLCVLVAAMSPLFLAIASRESGDTPRQIFFVGHLGLALMGLAIVENLFRNSPKARGWTIKYLCFGAGGIFAYDFFLYADAFLFHHLDVSFFLARGLPTLAVVPLLAVYAKRNLKAGPQIALSRQFAFYSTTFIVAGLYLLTMTAAGYYVRRFGGTWSTFLQALFFFGAILLLVVPIASGSVRAYLRVLLEKSLFTYQYDYRREWLRLIQTISDKHIGEELRIRVIQAVCDLMDSPQGGLWLPGDDGRGFTLAAAWNFSRSNLTNANAPIGSHSPLARFLEEKKWIIDLDELAREPGHYVGLDALPSWLAPAPHAWLVVPLLLDERLLGILVVGRSRAERRLKWEDFDILKTVGRQVASYLAQQQSDEALAEARQFEAFNKRFAFVAHDIKNLVSQLSLLLANSEKHRGNAEFQDAVVATVRQSVDKLNRMLRQLQTEPPKTQLTRPVELGSLLREVVGRRGQHSCSVSLSLEKPSATVAADEERLKVIVDHLIQNAVDAVGPSGRVDVRLAAETDIAVVEIADNGPGMDDTFVRDRLFRPFDSTKSAGYGIGVYESREYARSLGGRIEVDTAPGRGTKMRVCLPLAAPALPGSA